MNFLADVAVSALVVVGPVFLYGLWVKRQNTLHMRKLVWKTSWKNYSHGEAREFPDKLKGCYLISGTGLRAGSKGPTYIF